MQGIIDFHTHAFPDALADGAVKVLQQKGGIAVHLDGRISSLLESMDRPPTDSINYLGKQAVRELILNHSSRYVLFGTDSPWCDQEHVLCLLRSLELGQEREEMILRQNALDLLGATGD